MSGVEVIQYALLALFGVGAVVEIVPVKFSPLAWLGNRLNRDIYKKVGKIEKDLQEHVADDMRTYIIRFQNECLMKEKHTKEDWNRAYRMCDKYESYIEENRLKNSEADDAIAYIRKTHQHCLEDGDFLLKEAKNE